MDMVRLPVNETSDFEEVEPGAGESNI